MLGAEATLVDREHATEVALGLVELALAPLRLAQQLVRHGDVRVVGAESADVLLEQAQAGGLGGRIVAARQGALRLGEQSPCAPVVHLALLRARLRLALRGLRMCRRRRGEQRGEQRGRAHQPWSAMRMLQGA
ncbi:MAG: hypothetical protein A3D95_01840 [Betaproteobacteria bacterium RIFCSPHIGHO2_12_FULL_69_13]|nr:MAG: hypothetical protein A3D95_01840 [Betaproteobacteria bacterium RIFCSPHIGHO2_12_FULL_69_13]